MSLWAVYISFYPLQLHCTLGVLLSVILEKVVPPPILLKIWWEESLSALIADNKLALYYGRGKKWSELCSNDFFGSRTLLVTHINISARSVFWMILNVIFDFHSFSYNLSGNLRPIIGNYVNPIKHFPTCFYNKKWKSKYIIKYVWQQ